MTNRRFRASGLLVAFAVLGTVSACTGSSPFSNSRRFSTPPAQLAPVASSNVQSSDLPPLAGSGQMSENGLDENGMPVDGLVSQDPLLANVENPLMTPDGSFVAIDPTGVPTNVQTRDLSGSLSVQTMLGAWTVISGADQCRINLTQTTKQGTDRFRASAPNCPISVLSEVASWKLAGTQVQFYNGGGQLIGTLLKSGNRFIGTLAGGQGISMAG
ncbi:MAG: protease inhibitor Inh/omp19 family protein [Devosiaceae bacterium]|nr:protease inhibitor Inh/omp19 family protein [Devosiaceae bacterium]